MLGSMINMDAPRHTKLRLLVNKGFTPRMVARIEDYVHDIAREIVRGHRGQGLGATSSPRSPRRCRCGSSATCSGIPRERQRSSSSSRRTTSSAASTRSTTTTIEDIMAGGWNLWNYAQELGRSRLADPQRRHHARRSCTPRSTASGSPPRSSARSSCCSCVGRQRDDPQRHQPRAAAQLTRHPEQRRSCSTTSTTHMATAVEEIVRWATPVIHFRRTATAGHRDRAGARRSRKARRSCSGTTRPTATRTSSSDPYDFDITRSPNEHVGFGGGGPHFCLGANLARREIRVMFEELFQRAARTSRPPASRDLLQSQLHPRHQAPARRLVITSSGSDFLASSMGWPQSGTGTWRATSTTASHERRSPAGDVAVEPHAAVAQLLARPATSRASPSRSRGTPRARPPGARGEAMPGQPAVAGEQVVEGAFPPDDAAQGVGVEERPRRPLGQHDRRRGEAVAAGVAGAPQPDGGRRTGPGRPTAPSPGRCRASRSTRRACRACTRARRR